MFKRVLENNVVAIERFDYLVIMLTYVKILVGEYQPSLGKFDLKHKQLNRYYKLTNFYMIGF
jgi:hypothetical protein